jgi:hypothetical protein
MSITYSLIKTVTVGSGGTSSIDFTSIPSTYTDLVLKLSARTDRPTSGYGYFDLAFNGSTANGTYARLNGYASGVNTGYNTQNIIAVNTGDATANTFANWEMILTNYAGSYFKAMSIEAALQDISGVRETPFNQLGAGLWSSTAAINRITLSPWSGYGTIFYQNTTCSLYGILKA